MRNLFVFDDNHAGLTGLQSNVTVYIVFLSHPLTMILKNCRLGPEFLHETVWDKADFRKQGKMSCSVAVNVKKALAKPMTNILTDRLHSLFSPNNTRHASAGFNLICAPRRVSCFWGIEVK